MDGRVSADGTADGAWEPIPASAKMVRGTEHWAMGSPSPWPSGSCAAWHAPRRKPMTKYDLRDLNAMLGAPDPAPHSCPYCPPRWYAIAEEEEAPCPFGPGCRICAERHRESAAGTRCGDLSARPEQFPAPDT